MTSEMGSRGYVLFAVLYVLLGGWDLYKAMVFAAQEDFIGTFLYVGLTAFMTLMGSLMLRWRRERQERRSR